MNRRTFLGGLAAAAAAQTQRPNVVLIMADDLGYECLGCYGGTAYRTPNLDRLAATGVRFTHAYAQPLCTPTRLQLMTGQYNFRNWQGFGLMAPKERTFGHMMREAGYKTAIAGKWQFWSYDGPGSSRRGIGQRPEDSGFDEYSLWHVGHTEDKKSRYADPTIIENGRERTDTKGKYGEDLFAEFLCSFMEKDRANPFFVYYPMALTHAPFNPTPKSKAWPGGNRLEQDPKHFGDMVEYMDEVVGRVVKKIDDLGLRSRTLILFYGDNGTPREITTQYRGQPYRGGKGLTTEAGMRVPLIANWQGVSKSDTVVDALIDSTDFIPTLADATGVKPLPGAVDGQSFLPLIRGEKANRRDWIFSHYDPHPGCKVDFMPTRFAFDRQWKLYMDGRLYDLATDPLEQLPMRAPTPQAAAARKKLQAVLDRMAKEKPPKFNEYSAFGPAY